MLYSKAPITEATIDIRIALPEDFPLSRLEEFQAALGNKYNEKQQLHFDELLVQLEAPRAAHRSQQFGFRFINDDKRRIVQVRLDGLAFSLLAPYSEWDLFSEEARQIWAKFREAIQPTAVTRLGVRYINRLDVPSPSIELKDYLATFPEVSEAMPQLLLRYFMQLVLPMEDIKATAVINQAIVPPPLPDTTSIMLDVDLFRDQEVPQSEKAIWEVLKQLRAGENQIFDACLTEKAKGLIR